jgi:uncharacterized short protein YbdD (DUF466 family)
MVGVPSYDNYVKHYRECHSPKKSQKNPQKKPMMTYEEFFRERQEKRYASGSGKCC